MKIFFLSLLFISNAQAQFKKTVERHVTGKSALCTKKVYYKRSRNNFSNLGKEVIKGIRPYLKKGTVTSGLVTSRGNYISREVYNTGTEIFKKVRHLIRQAKKEVLVQTFLAEFNSRAMLSIEDGLFELQDRLKREKVKNPVEVKFVFNEPTGIAGLFNPFKGQFRKQAAFNKMRRLVFKKDNVKNLIYTEGIDPKYIKLEIKLFTHKLMGVSHSKSVVVDRSKAMIMGANMMRYHDRDALQENDFGYLLMGDVAMGLADDFYYGWLEAKPYAANYDNLKPSPIGHNLVKFKLPKVVDNWGSGRIFEKNVPMIIASRKERDAFIIRRGGNPVNKAILALIGNAKYKINIITPSLNSKYIVRAIIGAIKRGVEVNILLSKGFQDNLASMPFQGGTNLENATKIYKATRGARGKFRLNWFVDFKGRLSRDFTKENPNTYTSHTKYLAVDNQITMIGSTNLDTQSWYYSREVNVLIDDFKTTSKWCKRVFRTDFLRGQPFKLEKN